MGEPIGKASKRLNLELLLLQSFQTRGSCYLPNFLALGLMGIGILSLLRIPGLILSSGLFLTMFSSFLVGVKTWNRKEALFGGCERSCSQPEAEVLFLFAK